MNTQEGVTKFQLVYNRTDPLPYSQLREINAWRKILFQLKLIGRDPNKYGGVGYGNISQKLTPFDKHRFVISGTGTGQLAELDQQHYAVVLDCYPNENKVVAEGPIQPSSESLTHGMLYGLDPTVRFIMHVHSPAIWHHANKLCLPVTDANVAYGTPQMANEVGRLIAQASTEQGIILTMGGHEDGVIAAGCTAEQAGALLLRYLARAYQL